MHPGPYRSHAFHLNEAHYTFKCTCNLRKALLHVKGFKSTTDLLGACHIFTIIRIIKRMMRHKN